jgi:hypothetical protein
MMSAQSEVVAISNYLGLAVIAAEHYKIPCISWNTLPEA